MSKWLNFTTMGLLTLLGLMACKNTSSFYAGTFNDEPYELLSIETKGFSTNHIDYALALGRWERLEFTPLTTDWGPPYADDLYGNARRIYIDQRALYSNEPDNATEHKRTMLYLSPNRFSPEVFARYADFMKTEWPKIDRQFGSEPYSRFPHVIGLVYGEQPDYVRVFKGKKEGKPYMIKVEPDGRIRYVPDTDYPNDEYSGLSEKVQMPGKIIWIATGKAAGLSLEQVRTYIDASGKGLSDYFTLKEKAG